MKAFSAWHDRRSVIAVIDFFISGRKRVNVETVCVEKVREFLTPVQIKRLFKSQLRPYFEQSLNDF